MFPLVKDKIILLSLSLFLVLWFNFVILSITWLTNFFCKNLEGQPESIVQEIENMVRSYIEKVSFNK